MVPGAGGPEGPGAPRGDWPSRWGRAIAWPPSLVVEEEGHRRARPEADRELHRLPQAHDPGDPAAVDEVGDAELGDFLDELVVVGGHVDMLVVAELGVDAQVLAGADRCGQGLVAAAGEVAGGVEFEDASPPAGRVVHGVSFLRGGRVGTRYWLAERVVWRQYRRVP